MIIEKNHRNTIETLLNKHFKNSEIWYFGSRVKGHPRKYSDVDILIKMGTEKIPLINRFKFEEDYENTEIPLVVDIIDWYNITEDFREMILSTCEHITYQSQ